MTSTDQTDSCTCGQTCACKPGENACDCGTACACGDDCTCTSAVGSAAACDCAP